MGEYSHVFDRMGHCVLISRYDFDQYEVVLALESVKLESESMPGGYRDFIAVGTGFDFAEDRATRGNVSLSMDWRPSTKLRVRRTSSKSSRRCRPICPIPRYQAGALFSVQKIPPAIPYPPLPI